MDRGKWGGQIWNFTTAGGGEGRRTRVKKREYSEKVMNSSCGEVGFCRIILGSIIIYLLSFSQKQISSIILDFIFTCTIMNVTFNFID